MIIFLGSYTEFYPDWIGGIFYLGPKYKGPVSDHFDGSRFINPGGIKAKGLRKY